MTIVVRHPCTRVQKRIMRAVRSNEVNISIKRCVSNHECSVISEESEERNYWYSDRTGIHQALKAIKTIDTPSITKQHTLRK